MITVRIRCCFKAFYPRGDLLEKKSQSSQSLLVFYPLGLCHGLNPQVNSLRSIVTWRRFHLEKPLPFLTHEKELPSIKVRSWDRCSSVPSSGSTSYSNSLPVSTTSAVTSFTEVWNLLKSSVRLGINFQTPVNTDILTSSCESQMFLMAS